MAITKSGGGHNQGLVSGRQRCWDCGEFATVFYINPASGQPLCGDCGGPGLQGIISTDDLSPDEQRALNVYRQAQIDAKEA